MPYRGVIIEESLENTDVLKLVKILDTKISPVNEKHQTPWVKQWTKHTVEVAEDKVEDISRQVSQALDHEHDWYADYKNETTHYIIFRDKVFKVDRTKKEEYEAAKEYGLSLGIPDYQLNFSVKIIKQ